jgi:hypothetical protein
MLPPSLEVSFWVTALIFPVLGIVFSLLVSWSIDDVIVFVSGPARIVPFIVFSPLLFSITHAAVFLCSTEPGAWDFAAAVIIVVAGVVAVVLLYLLQSRLVSRALIRSASESSMLSSVDSSQAPATPEQP